MWDETIDLVSQEVNPSSKKNSMNESTRKGRWKTLAIVLVVLGGLMALTLRPPKQEVPASLIGQWHTSAPNYADRYFEISPVSISFTTGNGTGSTGILKDIQQVHEGTRTLYTFRYDVEDSENQVSFFYEGSRMAFGTIQFKNQPGIVWKKSDKN